MKIILLVSFLFTLLFSKPLERVTLQLQWKHQFEYAGFYAAKEKGFYEDVGLDVTFSEFESGMDITQKVVSGEVEYATSYSSIILDYLHKKPIVFVANFFKQSPLVLAVQPEIKMPSDLVGKKIMGILDSVHNETLLSMLEKFDISSEEFIHIPRSFNVESFANREVDAMSLFTTNEVLALNEKNIAYNIFDPAAFGIKFYDLNLFTSLEEVKNNPKRVEDFRQASIKGWEYALQNREEIVELILHKYNSQNKTKEALLFEAKQIEYLVLANVHPVGSIDLHMVKSIADSYKQKYALTNIDLVNLEKFIFQTKSESLNLTLAQREYLKEKKRIRVCVDPNWMPLEMIENHRHVGIGADILELISKSIETPFILVPTSTWKESIQKMKEKRCDILSLAEKTPTREEHFNFTSPYIIAPLAVVTKSDMPFRVNLEAIKDKKLGVVSEYSTIELLQQKYEGINIVELDSIEKGFRDVRAGQLFGFLNNSMVLNHEIQKNGYKDLAITGQFQTNFELSIATRKDEPFLHDIIQKALLELDNETKSAIITKWTNIHYRDRIDFIMLAKILFAVFVFVGLSIYWNILLRKEMRKKEEAKRELEKSEEKFRTLFDVAPVMLNAFDAHGKIVLWNKECEKVFGFTFDELKDIQNPIALFYPDIEDQKRLLKSLRIKNKYEKWCPQNKSGETITTLWANVVLPADEVIHIGYDITQQEKDTLEIEKKTDQLIQIKEELESLNKTLEERIRKETTKNVKQQLYIMQNNKLAQMGEMIANIAHQWRQPLAQINSCVLKIDVALENQPNQIKKSIGDILNEVETLTSHMSKTISDFQNFFDPDKEKQTFKLQEAVDSAYAITKGALDGASINVIKELGSNLEIDSYMKELEHVLLVILNNAKDALVAYNPHEPTIKFTLDEDETHLYLSVCDNGGGIKEEHLGSIFDPYFTTKHKSQGIGIGLYMAKMIIDDGLKGRLLAYNHSDGACFEIVLLKGDKNG